MASLKELLKPLAEDGAAMTREQAAGALELILTGEVPEVETAALLTVLATRGELAPELAGFVQVMRERVTPLPLTDAERDELVDVVGTGGGGPLTFNISSGAALVAAAAGAKVAKHGNRAVTSLCGAADVLEALDVPIALGPELAVECLRETGFMFLFAPLYHPAMKALGPLRRALGFRTIFNLCGPLTNPAGANCQVLHDGENGLLAGDAGEWYTALARLAADPDLRARLAANGHETVARDFAACEDVPEMTEAHWVVVNYLRNYYLQQLDWSMGVYNLWNTVEFRRGSDLESRFK